MSETRTVLVEDLSLDLKNFRTVPQKDEYSAVKAMISIKPEYFWALMESILDDGYLPTENIIVLKQSKTKLVVKEGNRRIAVLKIILGLLDAAEFNIPTYLTDRISKVSSVWKNDNKSVPCSIFEKSDSALVDKIVALTHAKGEKAGRDQWSSVARARHNRDMEGSPEPGLDLLEKYLISGKNITEQQKERWAGDYHLTVLDEALGRVFSRLGFKSVNELVSKYPAIKNRDALEEVMRVIGVGAITFPMMRDPAKDIFGQWGIPGSASSKSATAKTGSPTATSTAAAKGGASAATKSSKAYSISDPRTVKTELKRFNPRGSNRAKVATLRDEAIKLDITKTPLAFSFLLRSMFEISAKAYCDDNNISLTYLKKKRDGSAQLTDKTLIELLKEVTNHLTNNNADKARKRLLFGAIAELGRKDGILSVTSMNQLVHNPAYSITSGDISTLFGNIYPLLEFMN
jgi:hypothetical protein